MLSALIPSQLSYPAMLLAEQLVYQRLVRSGPLVKLFLHFCKLRLYLRPLVNKPVGGRRVIQGFFLYPSERINVSEKSLRGQTYDFSQLIPSAILPFLDLEHKTSVSIQEPGDVCEINRRSTSHGITLYVSWSSSKLYHLPHGRYRIVIAATNILNEGSTVISRIFITDYSVK